MIGELLNVVGYYQQAPTDNLQPSDARQVEPLDDENGEWAGNSFSDKAIRHAFIKKVKILIVLDDLSG